MDSPPDWVTLTAGEEVVWTAPPSVRPYVVEMLVPLAFVLAGPAVLVVPVDGLPLVGRLPGAVPGLAKVGTAGLFVAVGLVGVGAELLRWYSHQFLVTTEEVYHKRGVVSRDVTNVPLDRVEHTTFTKSPLGRLLSYGDVHVATAGTDITEVVFTKVDDPDDVVERITRQMAAQ